MASEGWEVESPHRPLPDPHLAHWSRETPKSSLEGAGGAAVPTAGLLIVGMSMLCHYHHLPPSHGWGEGPTESQGQAGHTAREGLGCNPRAWLPSSAHTKALSLMASDQRVATCLPHPEQERPVSLLLG